MPLGPPPDADDAQLLRAFIDSRDDLAFGRIVARHAAGVRRTALLETGNAEAAEDVTQATFIVLSRRPRPALRSAKRKSSAEPWLHQVARYAAANWRRAEHRRRKREKAVAMPDRTAAQDPSQSTDLAEAVAAALRTLRRRDRRLILLRHVEEKPWSEVAQRVNMTPEAARKATDRASERLRVALQNQGIIAAPSALAAGLHAIGAPASTATAAALPLTSGASVSISEIAKGTIAMMNLKSAASAGLLASALIFGGAGAIVLAQEEPQQPAARPAQVAEAQGSLEARLSDGATVKLKAVGDATGWWRPDGGAAVSRTDTMLEQRLWVDQRSVEKLEKAGRHEEAKAYKDALRMGFVVEFQTPRDYLGRVEVRNASTYRIARKQKSFESDGVLLQLAPDQEPVIEVSMPVGEPISEADVQLYSLPTQEARLDGARVGLTPLSRTPGLGVNGADATTTTVIYEGDLDARTIHARIVTDDGKVLIGDIYMQSEVGDTHSLIFSFGLEQIPHPEDGRLHLSLMPLELVRFSDFATSKDQKTEPKVEVLSHEQYVAMLKGRAAKTPSPAPADEASPQPPS